MAEQLDDSGSWINQCGELENKHGSWLFHGYVMVSRIWSSAGSRWYSDGSYLANNCWLFGFEWF